MQCQCCGSAFTYSSLEVHEIDRRSQAPGSWGVEVNLLLVCRHCHAAVIPGMSHAEQLCLKRHYDPEHFDLQAWLKIRDPELKAPNRVTIQDIDDAADRVLL